MLIGLLVHSPGTGGSNDGDVSSSRLLSGRLSESDSFSVFSPAANQIHGPERMIDTNSLCFDWISWLAGVGKDRQKQVQGSAAGSCALTYWSVSQTDESLCWCLTLSCGSEGLPSKTHTHTHTLQINATRASDPTPLPNSTTRQCIRSTDPVANVQILPKPD